MVTLEPMSADAWAAWRAGTIKAYAEDMVRTGSWPGDGAEGKATAEFDQIAPEGQATLGHGFYEVLSEAGLPVGSAWVAPADEAGRGALFFYNLVIAPEFRGHGYGRASMAAVERLALSLGYDAIWLHVFGDNTVARKLYLSIGYIETDVSMLKTLV